jgi:hypothetical protein
MRPVALRSPRARSNRALPALLALLVALLFVAPADALAGGKKKKGGKKGKHQVTEIHDVGIKSIDAYFADARNIDNRLDKAQGARRKGRVGINEALGLDAKTPLNDALKQLKQVSNGNLAVALTDGIPTLQAVGAVPDNVVGAIEAVNIATNSYVGAISQLTGVPERAASLAAGANKLPKQLKKHYSTALSNPLEIPKMIQQTKVLKDNIALTAGLPKRSRQVVQGLNQDMSLITSTFGGSWAGSKGGKKNGKKKSNQKKN